MSVNLSLETVQKELHLLTGQAPEHIGRLHGPSLTVAEHVETLLMRSERILGVNKPSIAASQFTKWYCRSLTAVLYEFSVQGVARSATLRDVAVLFPGDPPFAVACNGRTVAVSDATRESLRELTMIRLFAHNWNLVFRTLHQLTGIREDLLWENGSVYIHFYYRKWIAEEPDLHVRQRLEEDYRYIHYEAPPELYGELQCFNPLQWTGKPVRGMCCLRYHMPDGRYCKICPIKHAKSGGEA